VVPADADPASYVELVTGPMLEACAPHARWVDAFCERGAFDADQARAVLTANLETAINGVWDAAPQSGDRVVVLGAGTVGCLVAWLLRSTAGVSPFSTRAPLLYRPARHRVLRRSWLQSACAAATSTLPARI